MIHQAKEFLSVVLSIFGLYLFYKLIFKPAQDEKSNKFIYQNELQNEETHEEIIWDCEAQTND